MVALMRWALAMLVLSACVGGAFAEPARDVSGGWRGETSPDQVAPPYFAAMLIQHGQTLSGAGYSNRCPACRGFDQFDVTWSGSVKGDIVLLIARHPGRPWESEQHYEGVLSADGQRITGTYRDGRNIERFVMERAPNGVVQ